MLLRLGASDVSAIGAASRAESQMGVADQGFAATPPSRKQRNSSQNPREAGHTFFRRASCRAPTRLQSRKPFARNRCTSSAATAARAFTRCRSTSPGSIPLATSRVRIRSK